MTLKEAYEFWQRWREDNMGSCCHAGHFSYSGVKRWIPRPDKDVCAREKAWRMVVRIRDNQPNWPFDLVIGRTFSEL
jgi:hypothetical protein